MLTHLLVGSKSCKEQWDKDKKNSWGQHEQAKDFKTETLVATELNEISY